MKKYHVHVYDSVFDDLYQILKFKLDMSQTNTGAIKFRDEILEAIDNLHTLPLASKPLSNGYRAKVISGHYLIFEVDENTSTIVSDL